MLFAVGSSPLALRLDVSLSSPRLAVLPLPLVQCSPVSWENFRFCQVESSIHVVLCTVHVVVYIIHVVVCTVHDVN